MERQLTRRGFVGVVGAGGAALLAEASIERSALAGEAAGAVPVADGQSGPADDGVSPIAPLAEPQAWDREVDVVVAGTGGGLVAALRCAELGAKVAAFDPEPSWGGSSKETDILAVMGTDYQTALWEQFDLTEAGMPGMTLADMIDSSMGSHDKQTMRAAFNAQYLPQPGGTTGSAVSVTDESGVTSTQQVAIQGHVETVEALTNACADATDWLMGKIAPYGVTLGPVTRYGSSGLMFLCPQGSEAGGFVARANYTFYEAIYQAAVDAGVEFGFGNAVTGLVVGADGSVVGVQTVDGLYTKANLGVILATGGISANRAMLEKYCPTVCRGSFTSTSTVHDDGSGIRMGLGVGGFIDGTDSANCFDGGMPVEGTNRYLYKGDVQFARNVPSLFNIRGERVPWFSLYTIGFTHAARALMGQPGGYAIAVADAEYERIMNESTEPICRMPITPEMMAEAGANADRIPDTFVDDDWRIGFQEGLDGGWIVSADTVAGLAEKLGVNADNLQKGVDAWNAACDAGVDELFGIEAALLRPIREAPFYAAKVNGTILNTFCGLGVDWRTCAVLDAAGSPIAGLYAAGTTAGGSSGCGSMGATMNPGGGAAYAYGTCFAAANAIMGA